MNRWRTRADFIMSIADLLRGDYRPSEYGRVMLPFVLLRRLDCVLEPTKPKVLEAKAKHKGKPKRVLDRLLGRAAKQPFYNTSQLDFTRLLDDPENIAKNLTHYIRAFSGGAVEVLDKYRFDEQVTRLDNADLLYLIVGRFADTDLHPDAVSNTEMGYIFEELIRRFSEQSNEAAGEHFTPREVVALKVNLLFAPDADALKQPGTARTLYDPAAGTGGMLSVAEDHLRTLNENARLHVFGQELNDESYAICRSDMMLKGQDPSRIAVGNSLSSDAFPDEQFDYMISNPPYGVEWKKIERTIRGEQQQLGDDGRFGAGLPSIEDGSLLFLQHMVSKMKAPTKGGSRISIVFNESPLFKGAPGSGESRIRQWILEHDWLEAVVALPDQLFYNTGIATYVWLVTNHKSNERKEKVQLIDARDLWERMPKSLGEKRKRLTELHIEQISRIYRDFREGDRSRILSNKSFGFQRVPVHVPLRARYSVTEETLTALRESKALLRFVVPSKTARNQEEVRAKREQAVEELLMRLEALKGLESRNREKMEAALEDAWDGLSARLTKPVKDAVWDAATVRDPTGEPVPDKHGDPRPDPTFKDHEQVPLTEAIDDYVEREVRPEVPDAWVDESKARVGYQIPLTRIFYKPVPLRPSEEIDAEIQALESEILTLLKGVTA